jgi:hypothetical protein
LGHDGNLYYCVVCSGFGDVVCCDVSSFRLKRWNEIFFGTLYLYVSVLLYYCRDVPTFTILNVCRKGLYRGYH